MKKEKAEPQTLARLIRFVGPGVLPPGTAAQYDAENNLVRIDKALYDTLNVLDQSELIFTTSDVVCQA